MKANLLLLFPGEKGSARYIHNAVNFCNLLPLDKVNNEILQREWVSALWDKIPKNMKVKNALKDAVKQCTTLKSLLYIIGKYHYDIAQLNKPVENKGLIFQADPKYSFHYNSLAGKRKDLNNEEKGGKDSKTHGVALIPCHSCGRSAAVKVNGKSVPYTVNTCFCFNHVDKNISPQP